MTDRERIIEYYDRCEIDYRLVWDLKKSLAMHYGYWDESTGSHREALANMNRQLAIRAGIRRGERILDAGCGVGGSSIFLAKELGCRAVGITLSRKQAEKARKNASVAGVEPLVEFHEADYTDTGFERGAFDVVWAIESVCYCRDKGDFLREAYRLLRKGGRVAVADFFSTEKGAGPEHRKMMESWTDGWAVPEFSTFGEFLGKMKAAGFRNISTVDVTRHIMPSAGRLYRAFFPGIIATKTLEIAGLRNRTQTANVWTIYRQYKAFTNGLCAYGMAVAEK